MDDLNHVKDVLKQGDWMMVNDLDSGYCQVPVCKDSWQYLGVHFIEDDGSVTFWTWRVLVLGIIDANNIFTRLLAPLIAKLRSEGIRGLIYIDNLFLTAATKQLAHEHSKRAFELFAWCGWKFNQTKSSGEPLQVVRFLGLDIDSRDLSFNIPENKLREIRKMLGKLKNRGVHAVHVKQLAKAVGTLQSL